MSEKSLQNSKSQKLDSLKHESIPYFSNVQKNKYRDDYCSNINENHIEQTVTVAGWVDTKRDHGHLLFIDLRDTSGILQCVFQAGTQAFEIADGATKESVIQIKGKVVRRTPETCNKDLRTGMIEIHAEECVILSKANPLPFDLSHDIPENMKLEHRYLYLRKEKMQENLLMRAEVITYLRNAMRNQGFLEVQTPILTASSPEGARDYLVPSRVYPGKFYALPQAPQQFKQLLMASGVNKYFQIAPCFRDEESRADRSPGEFYQLDFEIAFATQQDVFNAIEPVLEGLFKKFFNGEVTSAPFPIITYSDSIEKYCSDKPDLRNPLEYTNITSILRDNPPQIFEKLVQTKDFYAVALPVPGAHTQSRKTFDDLQGWVQSEGLGGLAYAKFSDGEWSGPGAKLLPQDTLVKLLKDGDASREGVIFILAGPKNKVIKVGGALRNKLFFEVLNADKEMPKEMPKEMKFCWIVDFPMYELDENTNQIVFSHNPFSMPQGGMEALNTMDPLEIKAWQYDIVCNGIELSSGAIRNHEPETLKRAFEIAGYDPAQTEAQFGAMVHAFGYGVPPHGGSAPGIDRIVMLLCNEANIREIIAFPLSQNAQDLLMQAPAPVTEAQLKELHLQVIDSEKKKYM